MLDETNAYVVRSTRPNRDHLYMESSSVWNASPAYATIFRSHEAGMQCLADLSALRMSDETLDVVPLYGALKTSGRKV